MLMGVGSGTGSIRITMVGYCRTASDDICLTLTDQTRPYPIQKAAPIDSCQNVSLLDSFLEL